MHLYFMINRDCLQLTLTITLFIYPGEFILQVCSVTPVGFDLNTHKPKAAHFYIHILLLAEPWISSKYSIVTEGSSLD